jgi:hypothetical protein
MAGILNKKTRFMDTFLTQVGRDQLAHGELRFSFATFSDSCTFYERSIDDNTVVSDAANRIFFECANRPQDQVIPEFDDDGAISFPAGDFDIEGGSLIVVAASGSASNSTGKVLTGVDMCASASVALSNCVESFQQMMPLRSEDVSRSRPGFELSSNEETIKVSGKTLPPGFSRTVNLKNLEPLWEDKKLTQVANFQFLPPVSKVSGNVIREFQKLQQPAVLSFSALVEQLSQTDVDPVSITFPATSLDNNVVVQVFEITSGSMEKLRMIDFGEFEDEDPTNIKSLDSPGKHCFFAGKLFHNKGDEPTFVNIFTVVFD